jgi:hypothetical protein
MLPWDVHFLGRLSSAFAELVLILAIKSAKSAKQLVEIPSETS